MSCIVELLPGPGPDGVSFSLVSHNENEARLQIFYIPGDTVAQAVYLSGAFPPPDLCSGIATCGKCAMRFVSSPPLPSKADTAHFAPEELEAGWRLACRHAAYPEMLVTLPQKQAHYLLSLQNAADTPPQKKDKYAPGTKLTSLNAADTTANTPEQRKSESQADRQLGLAIDFGTTSVWWSAISLERAEQICAGSMNNPQLGAGSDVVSRIAAAREKPLRLQSLSLAGIKHCLRNAQTTCGNQQFSSICIAGNPAMSAIILGKAVDSLAAAPYALPYAGGAWENPWKNPDDGLPPVYFPPQLSPFVGGDISAGYAALMLNRDAKQPDYPFLLADMGTNGEFLLALSPEKSLIASVALGPALEGIGLSAGTGASPGAIADFSLSPGGLVAHRLGNMNEGSSAPSCLSVNTPHEQAAHEPNAEATIAAAGITGTGYLALVALLLQNRVLTPEGAFSLQHRGPMRRFFTPSTNERGELYLPLPHGLMLPAGDVEEILKVKAAFSLGLRCLLSAAGIASREITRVFLAGSLGRHVKKDALETLGFFPPGMGSRIEAVGNSSLAGAEILLRDPLAREALQRWSGSVETVDLANDAGFSAAFAENMRFIW